MSDTNGHTKALHVMTHSGWYRFEKNGGSWNQVERDLTFWNLSCIAVDPEDPRTVYGGTEHSGLFYTHDGGESWTRSSPNVPHLDIFSLWALPGSLFVGTRPAALFHGAPGKGWTELPGVREGGSCGVFPPNPAQAPRTRYLTADPASPSRLYAGIEVGGLLVSDDKGEDWRTANEGLWDRDIHQLHHCKHEPEMVVAACGEGIFRSRDRAAHWDEITPSDTRTYGTTVTETDDGSLYLGVTLGRPNTWVRKVRASAAILRSEHEATGWKTVAEDLPGGIMDTVPDPDGPGIIAATSEGEIMIVEESGCRTIASGLPCINEIALGA